MKRLITLAFVSMFLFIGISLQAQDKIIKKNKEVIECKITKVGVKIIEYTQPQFSSDVSFSIPVDRVERIEFESGNIINLAEQYSGTRSYNDSKKNMFKVDLIAPFTGNFTFAYERSIKTNRSIEASLGIIGMGFNTGDYNPTGAFLRVGHKFIIRREAYDNAYHYTNILNGFFIRPDINLSYFSATTYHYSYNPVTGQDLSTYVRGDYFSAAVVLNIGKQYVFDDAVAISWWFGFGYGFSNSDNSMSYFYSHSLAGDNSFPLAVSAGLTFGFLY